MSDHVKTLERWAGEIESSRVALDMREETAAIRDILDENKRLRNTVVALEKENDDLNEDVQEWINAKKLEARIEAALALLEDFNSKAAVKALRGEK